VAAIVYERVSLIVRSEHCRVKLLESEARAHATAKQPRSNREATLTLVSNGAGVGAGVIVRLYSWADQKIFLIIMQHGNDHLYA
jgi:hypothetical protein